ncbi:glutamate--tRNA ligase [Candidatus Woesebacteria bacterium RIFCSPHIGHO2_01_FULL_38_9]|uniref:Glutamate--tRNA ligase n=2 Tax=Candidatus Woeseibacteriota TaxID=1752722 RepID=A0A1F7XZ85_9BACT|nr:MAG: glutamate--tRNA ligase [Candidatus Woesebacteria bacterium RIFCSPHIGHO2_01_FULL_38_9]OGM58845.1 MAG: glutamate--tRNA ligase [Candidatus Woesebacteria bacterium RIFCSPLOWO2_01_FULL_39_10]
MAGKKVRTRMAPSPTGEYHIGHIRTLLYNWAFAKKIKGDFILRIEDTDRERYVEGATERILEVIKSYGFDWDEGPEIGGPYEPYFQSKRLEIYQKYSQELIDKGAAYHCFCSEDRLAKMREEQKTRGIVSTKYDRFCLKLTKDEVVKNLENKLPYVIRMKVPDNKVVSFNDIISDKISVSSNEIDDQVLIKSDGFPTYHFAVVVDDHLMKITHIMRGNDWIPSTPKHVLLYQSFGWELPYFAHIPNLKEMGAEKKLSKRYGAVGAKEFLDEGYLPAAVLNYLMFLGWSPDTEKEIYTLEEFVKDFSIEKIHKTDLVSFDRKKLLWMNGQYIQKLTDENFAEVSLKFAPEGIDKKFLIKIASLVKSRLKTLSELKDLIEFFVKKPKVDKKILGESWEKHLRSAKSIIEKEDSWSLEDLNDNLMKEIEEKGFKTGKFFMDLRIAITGKKETPPINDSIIILGKDEVIERLNSVLSIKP